MPIEKGSCLRVSGERKSEEERENSLVFFQKHSREQKSPQEKRILLAVLSLSVRLERTDIVGGGFSMCRTRWRCPFDPESLPFAAVGSPHFVGTCLVLLKSQVDFRLLCLVLWVFCESLGYLLSCILILMINQEASCLSIAEYACVLAP